VIPVLVILALAFGAGAAFAQNDSATISGRITDQSGEVLADVHVRVTNVDTAIEMSARSNADGIYVVSHLRPGRHRLTVEKEGFATIAVDGLALAVQDVLGRNFVMQLAPVKSEITVSAGSERNLSPAVSTVVDRQFVEQMPLNGRSFQSLIHLTPGVLVTPAGQGMEGQFSVNGQRTNTHNVTVDGLSVNFGTNVSVRPGQNLGGTLPALTIGGGTNSYVSVDAMQEFRTQTSSYTAEFGRTPGAQIAIVTKSGTNQLHGTAYDYVRDDALNARNWFNRPPNPEPPMHQHDFGGTLGGPIRANRSFFFGSYEGLRLREPRLVTANFYTPEARAAVAPVYRPIVDALPVPDGPLQDPTCDNVTRPCLASLTASYSVPTTFDASSLRLDHTFKERFTLFARGQYTPSSSHERTFATVESARRNTSMLASGLTAVLGASLVNDLRVGWGRATGTADVALEDFYGAVSPNPSALFAPGRGARDGSASFILPLQRGVTAGQRVDNTGQQLHIVNTMSTVAGAHEVKIGVDYRHRQHAGQGTNSSFVVLTDFSQLRQGTMGTVTTFSDEPMTLRTHNWSFFAQDTWKAAANLTVSYGLRWEIVTPPISVVPGKPLYAINGIFDSQPLEFAPPGTPLWRTRYDNFAPRAGIAWQAARATMVRGGAGVFHDLGYGSLLDLLITSFPYSRMQATPLPGQPFDLANPAFDRPPITPTLTRFTSGTIGAFDPDLRLPVVTQWNAAVEHELDAHHAVSVTYLGARGRQLLRPDVVVVSAPDTPSRMVTVTRNAGKSRYHALQVQARRRLHRGLQALASYTLAEARDTESDDQGGNFIGAPLNMNYGTSLDAIFVPPLAPADFDIRHAFAAAVSYELPAPPAGSFAHSILKDWGIDAIVRVSSPPPLNVRIEGVDPQFGVYRTQPDIVTGQPVWLSAADQPGGKILNPDAFTVPPFGVPGNLQRNSIRSPFSHNQTDLSLRRRFRIPGATTVEFRADVFNLFNHAMFGGTSSPVTFWGRCTATPCTGRQNPPFGRVSTGNTLNVGLGGMALSGGQSAIYAPGGPRSVQLSVKFRF
jgi:hypothetical protein